jgi:hypothetical protein
VPIRRPGPFHGLPISATFRRVGAALAALTIGIALIGPALARPLPLADAAAAAVGHLVISEVMTGGASASDEFIELYNPSAIEQALAGLEVVYVTASGATVTRKAAWDGAAAALPPGGHLLVANDAGAYGAVADATYANGLAATGGSVALRAAGGSTAIDAVGWGTAAGTWLEGSPAPAPPSGSSLERLPGGAGGSGQDTDDNASDFAILAVPDPQNRLAPPVPTEATPGPSASVTPPGSPTDTPLPTDTPPASGTPSPTDSPSATPASTVTPTATQAASPTPVPTASLPSLTIAEARALPDGTAVTVSGVALTGSTFSEGGGYLADQTASVAVLLSDGAFPRGHVVTVSGAIDDRYGQRTVRSDAAHLAIGDPADEPQAVPAATGSIGEELEGQLVMITGLVVGSGTQLSSGTAFDLDDGTGVVRVLVGPETGINTSTWATGVALRITGVVGQRDSSGTGAAGYRVQPRDPADVELVPDPTSSPGASPGGSATPQPTGSPRPLVSIAAAREAGSGSAVRIRGVVTVGSGIIDPTSAIVEDATGGLLVRMDEDRGTLVRGQLVELTGTRSTRSGMLTIRVDAAPVVLGEPGDPPAASRPTGGVGERDEARLVSVTGTITSSVLRSTANNVSFTVDDGSGEVRVVLLARAGISPTGLAKGVRLVVRGAVGQETTGAQPERGYRIWPRDREDLQILPATASAGSTTSTGAPATDLAAARESGLSPGSASAPGSAVAPALGAGGLADTLDGEGTRSARPVADAVLVTATETRTRALALLLVALATLLLVAATGWHLGVADRVRERFSTAPVTLAGSPADPDPAAALAEVPGVKPLDHGP